jgi:AraC-like DNA-binding protein
MAFRLYDLILILGIFQGLVAGVLMIGSKQFQPHQRLLGLIVVVFVTVILRALVYSLNWDQIHWLRFAPLGLELFLPPLMYFYVCFITTVSGARQPKRRMHWVLPFIWLSYDLLLYFMALIQPDQAAQNLIADRMYYDPVNFIEDKLILLSTWLYLILGCRRYLHFSRQLAQLDHEKSKILQRWIIQILLWLVVLALFLLLNNVLDLLGMWAEHRWPRWMGFNIYLALTTYYLGTLGMRLQSPRLFEAIQSIRVHQNKSQANDYDQLQQQLHQYLFVERHYLNPELNSQQVAEALNIPGETLSFLLNRKLKVSFRDLINQYRTEAVKTLIAERAAVETLSTNSILDLALEAGFNSQASFYRAFKKFVGITPLQFASQLKNR